MKAPFPTNPLNSIFLQLFPPPRNIAESQQIYKALEKFGKIDMFRIVRHDRTTKMPAPRAHVIFTSTNAGSSLLSASPLKIPSTRITVQASESRFPHLAYIRTESHIHAVRSSNLLNRRALVMGAAEAEKESGGLQEDTGGSFGDVEGGADIILRLKRRFTGGFNGFDSVEKGMVERKRKAGTVREEGVTEEGKVREMQSEGNGGIGKP